MTAAAPTRVIVNPVAAGGRVGRQWPQLQAAFRESGLAYSAELTKGPGHATELTRCALMSGYRRFVCVGGDGTLNEVLNGLVVGARPHPDAVLGIVPSGTGTDFARSLGLPRDPLEAARRVAHAPERLLDIGEIACQRDGKPVKHYFINVAGLGFDGEVTLRVNRSSKRLGGKVPFLSGLVLTLLSYNNKDIDMLVDNHHMLARCNSVSICNGQFFGGGMRIGPHAVLDDGLFDIVILKDLGRAELLANLPRVYSGSHLTHPKCEWLHGRSISVASSQRTLVQAEGEFIGEAPASFRILPKAIRVLA